MISALVQRGVCSRMYEQLLSEQTKVVKNFVIFSGFRFEMYLRNFSLLDLSVYALIFNNCSEDERL